MTTSKQPTAQIAVNKSVLKIYDGNKVYIDNNQEFSIELANPTPKNVAAEIYLNDQRAFTALLILRPGQRMFLECNPETKRKFKFETYKVDAGNAQVDQAIKNNGKVEVKFYNEKIPPISPAIVYNPTITICNPCVYPYNGYYYNGSPSIICGSSGSTAVGTTTTHFTNSSNSASFSFTADNLNVNTNNVQVNSLNVRSFKAKKLSKTALDQPLEKETGRVEAGSISGQQFQTVDKEFDSWAFHTTSVQIMPLSQKPVEQSIRIYCTECGLRNRNSWKFCPKCGAKF